MATLTTNAITSMLSGISTIDPILQITSIDSIQQSSSTSTKFRVQLSDGLHSHHALLPIQYNIDIDEEALTKGSVVQLQEYTSKNYKNYTAIVIHRLAIVHNSFPLIGAPTPLLQGSHYVPSTCSQDPSQSSQSSSLLSQEESSCSIQHDGPAMQLTPINALNPYVRNWSVEGRALAKTALRSYHNAKGDGKVFGFDLVDKDGSEIHVTCFNEVADKFYDVVRQNSIYIISGARLEEAKKQYSSSIHPYQIFLTMSSIISASGSLESTIPMSISHIKSIDTLVYWPDKSLVDVIGILCFISTPSTLRRRDGTETKRCTANIMDISGFTIDVTLWGRHCEVEGKQLLDLHQQPIPPIILIKSGRLTSWQGKK